MEGQTRVNLSQMSSLFIPCSSTVLAHTATGAAPATPRVEHPGEPHPPCAALILGFPGCSSLRPHLLPRAERSARAGPSRPVPPLAAPAVARHPASIPRARASLASSFASSTHSRARPRPNPAGIGPAIAGHHYRSPELHPRSSIPVFRSTSARFESPVSFPTLSSPSSPF